MTNTQSEKHTELPNMLKPHSLTPWVAVTNKERGVTTIEPTLPGHYRQIACIKHTNNDNRDDENAKFIVEAVNQHYGLKAEVGRLLKAMRSLKIQVETFDGKTSSLEWLVETVNEALRSTEQAGEI